MSKKHLTLEERKLILNLHVKQKKSYAEIGKILSRSRSTIQSVVGRFKYEGRVNNKRKPGRPKILSAGDLVAIKRIDLLKKNWEAIVESKHKSQF